ncbi:hypothetical protein CTI14_70900, partial [Methylobacterium radiotolerans]
CSTSPPTRRGRTCRSPGCSSTCFGASWRWPAPRAARARRAVPRHRRHDVVEPAALRAVHRHASARRGAGRRL